MLPVLSRIPCTSLSTESKDVQTPSLLAKVHLFPLVGKSLKPVRTKSSSRSCPKRWLRKCHALPKDQPWRVLILPGFWCKIMTTGEVSLDIPVTLSESIPRGIWRDPELVKILVKYSLRGCYTQSVSSPGHRKSGYKAWGQKARRRNKIFKSVLSCVGTLWRQKQLSLSSLRTGNWGCTLMSKEVIRLPETKKPIVWVFRETRRSTNGEKHEHHS